MAIATGRMALSFLAAALAAGTLNARLPQDSLRGEAAAQRLLASRAQLGLDGDHAFLLRGAHTDQLGQAHAHFQQTYKGVKVWGGDVITHTGKDGAELPLTNALLKGIQLNVTPALGSAEALAVVQGDLAPKGAYAYAPTTELVVYPEMAEVVRRAGKATADLNAEDVSRQVLRYTLAYHVHTELENDQDGIKHTDYLVDAHTGAILKTWNTLHTTAATGTGNSQYNGTVSLPTNYTGTTYELRDTTRGTGGSFGNNVVTNMAHAATTSTATGTLYTDADNTWGDGANYVEGSSTTAANGETAAVDAMFGMIKSWDYYKNVHTRNGIDGAGTATYSRVHISNSYDNAFWSDSCFCMTYGDGSSFTTLTALDVAGHEMSHGVCARTANLTYSGESGGLNESNSDIFGTMIEFYARGGSGSTIGNTGGNWTIGEQLATNPLRWMYKPSLDGSSPDAWSSTVGNLDVHYSSGPMNRCFYFLSQGATTSGNTSTTYLPSGMTGIGNDAAARIWFRALSVYMTSSTNYAGARTAAINAAKDLYGAGSAQEQAVWNAFHGINVGAAWTSGSSDTTAPTVSATESGTSGTITFSATASDNVGVTKVEFYVDGALKGSDTTSPYSMTLDSTTLTNASHTLTAKAYDAAGNVGTSTGVSFTVSNATSGAELVLNGGFESGATSWTQTSGVIGTFTGEPAHGGSYDAWMCGYGSAHTDYVYQQIAIPSTATGTLTFWLHVDTAETTTTTAYDTMKVQVLNTSGTVLATLATYSNLNKNTGYTQQSLSLSAYKGQTIRLRFYSVEDSSLQTSFVIDDVSVK
ncbi:M4 family metallopeptidase [Geothrix edaphica]|uniref:Peptidase M4 n=1 Tax=Geothrix edaphica TaxID=2927976 RepID=A0ABQ5PUI0_9BACT|nr:M4 family metallopeptidase [Geothrix edaphica]GLH65796.1 peptidase M4 [Geothrix edaphica]